MSKLKLLILDACVVIQLHEMGRWADIVARCDVYLSDTQKNFASNGAKPDSKSGCEASDFVLIRPAIVSNSGNTAPIH